jgi:hypothetical protein
MKHRAFKVIVFLLAGAIINVAVATWAWNSSRSAARVPIKDEALTALDTEDAKWLERSLEIKSRTADPSWPIEFRQHIVSAPTFELVDYFREYTYEEMTFTDFRINFMDESLVDLALADRESFLAPVHCARQWRIGWPFKSFEIRRVERGLSASEIRQSANPNWKSDQASMSAMNAIMWRILDPPLENDDWVPARIVWPEAVANSIFFATPLAVIYLTWLGVTRRIRIKRGQCASCGYSLRGITSGECPECGRTRARHSRDAA